MAVFSSRPPLYKIGAVLLVSSFVVFVVGFACPYWLYTSVDQYSGHYGIWELCIKRNGEMSCEKIGVDKLLESTKVYRGFLCLSLALHAVSCVIALFVNLVPAHRMINTTLHVLAIVAGVLGIGGTMSFVGAVCDVVDDQDHLKFYWAFYFTVLGSVGAIVAGLLMVTNSELSSANNPTTTTPYMTMALQPAGPYPVSQPAGSYPVSQPAGSYPVSQPVGPQTAGYPPHGQTLSSVNPVQAGYPHATAYPAGMPSK